MFNNLKLIRAGFTDYDQYKTMKKDSNYDYNLKRAIDNNFNFIIYYESRAVNLKEAKKELMFFESIIDYKYDFPLGIMFEDDHSNKIYYPKNQKNISKGRLNKIIKYMYNNLNTSLPYIITYNNWYTRISNKSYNIIFEDYG